MDLIFDIDGTLSNGDHRQHYLTVRPKNWKAYREALKQDSPHENIIDLFKAYATAFNRKYRINIATGRNESERKDTVAWLQQYGIWQTDVWNSAPKEEIALIPRNSWPVGLYCKLYMRADGDYRRDDIVKLEMLEKMRYDGYNPVLAVDDRDRVVKAWRNAGLTCLQVREGNF